MRISDLRILTRDPETVSRTLTLATHLPERDGAITAAVPLALTHPRGLLVYSTASAKRRAER
jgi:hypothetical protein